MYNKFKLSKIKRYKQKFQVNKLVFQDHKIPRKLNFLSLARFLTYTLALDDNESSRPKGNVVKGLSNSVLKGKNDHEHASVLAQSNSKNNGSLTIKVGHFSGDKGCFPFNKNSGLKFRKFHVPTGTVSYLASGYCSCKQGTTILSNGKGPSRVRPTENTRPVKEDRLQSQYRIFRQDQTEIVCSILCTNRNFRNLGLNGKRPKMIRILINSSKILLAKRFLV